MGGWAKKARCKAVETNSSNMVASTYPPMTYLIAASWKAHK